MHILIDILVILIGYLLGSVSPAYFLGKLLKQIDIREVGEKNAGTTNAYKILGFWPAVVTAFFDLSKGLLAMLIAYYFGLGELVIYLSGIAAVLGHIFPFYLGFRGGQGAATCTGILFYFLYVLLKQHFLPLESIGILLLVIIAILIITRQKHFLPLIIMPALAFMIGQHYSFDLIIIFSELILIYLFVLNIFLSYQRGLFKLKESTLEKIRPWRTFMRPLASVFPIGYYFLDRNFILLIIGIIGGIFTLVDITRLLSPRLNLLLHHKKARIYKKGEEKTFSSISLFLISAFLLILLFPKPIAIVAMVFLIFGDVFAKFFGLEYGKIEIFAPKTLEGSLAHLTVCLLVGYLMLPYVDLSPIIIATGALVATIVEALPLRINDNFSVSISAALAMLLLNSFM